MKTSPLRTRSASAQITLLSPDGVKCRFWCQAVVDGVAVNPVLPAGFDDTPHALRSDTALAWWGVPYVTSHIDDHPLFLKYWKSGTRYDVQCLDGGAWDRSTLWGSFATLAEAVAQAKKNVSAWRG